MPDPQRGEVWLVDLGLAAKIRPCFVLSIPSKDDDRALVTVVAHTTSPRGSRFEVEIKVNFLRSGVFDAQNLVTIPRAKLIRKLGVLSEITTCFDRKCCLFMAWALVFKCDSIVTLGGGGITFDSPDSFYYLALKSSNIYLVEERIE